MCKNTLISPQVLQYPDFSKPFILTTDASTVARGAVLAQEHGGIDMPLCFTSRTFTKREVNKATIEKELAEIHRAIMHFKHGKKFTVKRDHRPIVYLLRLKNPSSKLTRRRLDLEEFYFIVEFVKGKQNVVADAVSRIKITLDETKLKRMKFR